MLAEEPVEMIHACNTNSSAKSKRFILQFPTVARPCRRVCDVYPNYIDQGSSNF